MSGILQFFTYEHLPPKLAEASRPFCELARAIEKNLPSSAEKAAGLRKLLEAKDCIVRATIQPVAEEPDHG